MDSFLKRPRPAEASSAASPKRVKTSSRYDSSGRSVYYLANEFSARLSLPAISLRRLLSLELEDSARDGGAEAALFITERVGDNLVAEVESLCGGKVLMLTNETQDCSASCVLPLPTRAIRCNLWIVLFPDRLRVVNSTGSLHPWDLQRRLHTVWFQDFALGYRPCRFSFDLCRLVYELIPASVLADTLDINLGRYDFSPVAVDLITTVPGVFPSHCPFGLLQLLRSVSPTAPYSALLASTTQLPSQSLLLALQAQLNLPKYTTLHVAYPSVQTVLSSAFGLAGTCGSSDTSEAMGLYYDIELKKGLTTTGKTALPGYNILVLGGEMIPEDQMLIYCGCHSFSSEDWGADIGSCNWKYNSFSVGVAFRPGALQLEEARAILRSIPYAVGVRLGEESVPWEPRRHLIYL